MQRCGVMHCSETAPFAALRLANPAHHSVTSVCIHLLPTHERRVQERASKDRIVLLLYNCSEADHASSL